MTRRRRPGLVRLVAVAAAALVAATIVVAVAQQRAPGIGVVTVGPKGGWYTEEQAERGELAYTANCVRCHGVELEGFVGLYPPLVGPAFMSRWGGRPLERLYHYTNAMMPLDMPGSLSSGTYVDIIAYVLRENGLREGSGELRPDRHQLGRMILPESAPSEEEETGGTP